MLPECDVPPPDPDRSREARERRFACVPGATFTASRGRCITPVTMATSPGRVRYLRQLHERAAASAPARSVQSLAFAPVLAAADAWRVHERL